MMNTVIVLLVLVMSFMVTVNGRSGGAPPSTCISMTPAHGILRTGAVPYLIVPSKTSIITPETITVTVSASGGTPFKGFLLKTWPLDVGSFSNLPADTRLECSDNGVTHTTSAEKTNVSVSWTTSTSYNGNIQFIATIVEDYNNYYKDVLSSSISIQITDIVPDSNCGVSKGCFNDCQNGQCSYMLTWRDVGTDIEFEMAQTVTAGADKWIAVGFSQDQWMGDDDVVLCKTSNADIEVENGYNPGYYYQTQQNSTYGLSQTGGSLTGTKMTCTFRRTKNPVGQSSMVDFTDPYHLLLAHGDGILGNPSKHQESPNTSPTKANLLDSSIVIAPDVTAAPSTAAPVTTPGDTGISDPGCGKSKGCFPDCQGTGCSFLVSWASEGADIVFEIAAGIPSTNDIWMAIAFSSDDKMGSDSVVVCKLDNGVVSTEVGLNNGYSYQPLADPQAGLSSISGSHTNSVFRCKFRRAKNLTTAANFFDLNSRWHILFAHGLNLNGILLKHQVQPVASDEAVDFLSFELVSGTQPTYILTKVHGSFMSFAWILFSSVGIIIAKFFKVTWSDSKVAGQKVWFQVHRACMTTVLLCTIVGIITIFIDIEGYSKLEGAKSFLKAHPILGLIVTGLTLVNPIMALLRCGPDHKHRPIFNLFHSAVGISAHILAGITIVFGTYLDRSGLDRKSTYVAIAYIATFVLSAIILRLLDVRTTQRSVSVNIEMKSSSKQEQAATDVKKDNSGPKLFILAVTTVAMFAYSLVIAVMLIQGRK